jgi:light-regulated signal transduction histidine kinase (bacteriophytochrome)
MVLRRALANLHAAIEESGATVTHDALPSVYGDPVQLLQLLQNLIGNALKFRSEEPPRINVGCKREAASWRFSVSDNGIGIAESDSERVFGLFARLHSKDQYPGAGIGLALCKKIVDAHGGKIWLESAPGAGTRFSFTLPARVV